VNGLEFVGGAGDTSAVGKRCAGHDWAEVFVQAGNFRASRPQPIVSIRQLRAVLYASGVKVVSPVT